MVIQMDNRVLCIRVRDNEPVFPTSVKRKCKDCKQDVWVTPGTLQSIEAGLYPADKFICTVCFEKGQAYL